MQQQTMRAALVTAFAANKREVAKVISFQSAHQVPPMPLEDRQALVKVHAVGINPADYRWAIGEVAIMGDPKPPYVPGMDLAGVVVDVGERCERFKPGDAVWSAGHHKRQGTLAELAVMDEAWLGKKPPGLTFAEAASLPMASLAAIQALDAGGVGDGSRVVVVGASGGIGSATVQLAKRRGAAHVVGVSSKANEGLVMGLGADAHADYVDSKWWDALAGGQFDVIVDTQGGGESWANAGAVLKRGGKFVAVAADKTEGAFTVGRIASLLATAVYRKLKSRFGGPGYTMFLVDYQKMRDLERVAEAVEGGGLRPVVEKVYPLEESAAAFAHVAGGHAKGKVVVAIAEDLAAAK
eukprot:evm.model.scf_1375.6 EVM.evm.TU.scf_1375.6   scf_1375:33333-34391(+)